MGGQQSNEVTKPATLGLTQCQSKELRTGLSDGGPIERRCVVVASFERSLDRLVGFLSAGTVRIHRHRELRSTSDARLVLPGEARVVSAVESYPVREWGVGGGWVNP